MFYYLLTALDLSDNPVFCLFPACGPEVVRSTWRADSAKLAFCAKLNKCLFTTIQPSFQHISVLCLLHAGVALGLSFL